MENQPVVDLNWLCNWLEENSSGIYRPAKEAAHVIRNMSSELETLRAQLKAAKNQEPVAFIHVDTETGYTLYDNRIDDLMDGRHAVYIAPLPAQQSPAVAVPDEEELRRIFEEYYADDRSPIQRDAFGDYLEDKYRRTLNNDWDEWRRCRQAMLNIVSNQDATQPPRITEQDAREIINAYIENKVGTPVSEWLPELLAKLNR